MFGWILLIMVIIVNLTIISACFAVASAGEHMDDSFRWGTHNDITKEDKDGKKH